MSSLFYLYCSCSSTVLCVIVLKVYNHVLGCALATLLVAINELRQSCRKENMSFLQYGL